MNDYQQGTPWRSPVPWRGPVRPLFSRLPYWFLCLFLVSVVFLWYVLRSEDLRTILRISLEGLGMTLYVSLVSYLMATLLGLFIALMRISRLRPVREFAMLYIELIRGIPMLVILYYIAFVAAPFIVQILNYMGAPLRFIGIPLGSISIRDLDFTWRAIIALTIGYSAFIAEIFRGGMESVSGGQLEASLALGMNRSQAIIYIVLPQAFRNVLPALGNEFVAMIKDSALVSVLGVRDITLIGKVYASSTFRFLETYNIVAFLYLNITITLSIAVRALERYLATHKR